MAPQKVDSIAADRPGRAQYGDAARRDIVQRQVHIRPFVENFCDRVHHAGPIDRSLPALGRGRLI